MSRDTILDDAIIKAKEAEDWQLVEWLRMARGSESAARWYTEKLRDAHRTIRKILNENAKLRELVRILAYCMSEDHDCDKCVLNGADMPIPQISACDSLPDRIRKLGIRGGRVSREHAYAYEAGYRDGSINYELEHCPACKNVADLQEALAENAKLRELCADIYEMAYYEYPSAFEMAFAECMRELGIEVSNGQESQTQGEAAH